MTITLTAEDPVLPYLRPIRTLSPHKLQRIPAWRFAATTGIFYLPLM